MISVCIPTFDQYGYGVKNLTTLLDSMLDLQGKFEVVISDNSKGNGIQNLCKQYDMNIKYVRNLKTFGVSNNTNNAIASASHDLIKIMYMDDCFINKKALVLFEQALKTKSWAWSWSISIDYNGKSDSKVHTPAMTTDLLLGKNRIGMPSIIGVRKNEFTFDPRLKTLLDCEYYWLLHRKFGPPAEIPIPLIAQRYWKYSTSHVQGNHSEAEYEYLKKKHNL